MIKANVSIVSLLIRKYSPFVNDLFNLQIIYFTGMLSVWPDAAKWPQRCNIMADPMHGGTFNGNGCRELLRKTDVLHAEANLAAQPFVAAFKSLETVVSSCFGSGLDPYYQSYIDDFKTKYIDLVKLGLVNVTPKIHAIFYHIIEFCEREGVGLGRHSEQASESVHCSFKKVFLKYKVAEGHPDYASHLLKAVKDYNCCRV